MSTRMEQLKRVNFKNATNSDMPLYLYIRFAELNEFCVLHPIKEVFSQFRENVQLESKTSQLYSGKDGNYNRVSSTCNYILYYSTPRRILTHQETHFESEISSNFL